MQNARDPKPVVVHSHHGMPAVAHTSAPVRLAEPRQKGLAGKKPPEIAAQARVLKCEALVIFVPSICKPKK